MIGSPSYCAMMARYNIWQNAALLDAAETLDDGARRAERGAFFGSIFGTFNHLLWADLLWMARIDGGARPEGGIANSPARMPDWTALRAERALTDKRILGWADRLVPEDLSGELTWFSGASGREMRKPMGMVAAHLFNHQTHHRGQIHAMLTAAGARTAPTDLVFMPEGVGL